MSAALVLLANLSPVVFQSKPVSNAQDNTEHTHTHPHTHLSYTHTPTVTNESKLLSRLGFCSVRLALSLSFCCLGPLWSVGVPSDPVNFKLLQLPRLPQPTTHTPHTFSLDPWSGGSIAFPTKPGQVNVFWLFSMSTACGKARNKFYIALANFSTTLK